MPAAAVGRNAGNKKPAAHRIAGRVSGGLSRFRGGDDSRVHRCDCLGGTRRCGSCCRDGSAHSLPQSRLLGRNVITVFSTVNNPGGSPVGNPLGPAWESVAVGDAGRARRLLRSRGMRARGAPGTSSGAGSSRMVNFCPPVRRRGEARRTPRARRPRAGRSAVSGTVAGRPRYRVAQAELRESARGPANKKPAPVGAGSASWRALRRVSRRLRSARRSRRVPAAP